MNAKTGVLLRLVPVCLGLLPAAAAAQGSIGPLQHFSSGGVVASSARAGSLAFFTTASPTYPGQPFTLGFMRSDGTAQGTFSIDPRGPATPQGQAQIQFADSLGGLLFFTCAKSSALADRGLWRSDGTVAGTFPVTQRLSLALDSGAVEGPVSLSVPERSLMFFSASPRPESPDFELWATDGTPEGTRLVKDVNPEGSSNPRRMIAFGGRLFFFADTPQGRELWRSDGTPEGTERVHDLHPAGAEVLDLVQAGGALFVLAHTASDVEVWRSDGTEAGTERVLNLPQRLYEHQTAGRHLFLVTRDAAQHEMWAVDGSTGEAIRALQVKTSLEIQLLAVGDHVAFSLEDDHGWEPWWSDGTPAGTHRIADLCPGPCGSSPSFAGTYGERAVLRAEDGVSGSEPWLTDGTAAGTWRLGDLCPGECGADGFEVQEINGWLVLLFDGVVRIADGTPDGAWSAGSVNTVIDWLPLPDQVLFASPAGILSSLLVTAPAPPPAPLPDVWLESDRVPGFRFKARINGPTVGRQEPACMVRTLCVSGALPGRSEVFLRVSGPRPDGRLWPALVKLTTAPADVWVVQTATGLLRHYRLKGSGPAGSTLPGILDRQGFVSVPDGPGLAAEGARAGRNPQPPSRWIESGTVPGFRVQARLTSNGQSRVLRKEACIAETFCLSGAIPGLSELLVRVTGPKPNQYFWPMLARFAPATLEVWIQQRKTGKVRYYRLNAPPADSSQLDGYFDRQGFKR